MIHDGGACMLLASKAKIPAFLMAVMVANGTQAGNMSPIAVAGVIVKGLAQKMNLPDWSFILWMNSLVYFFAIGIGAYLFRNMLIWGLAMTPIGAVVCWILFTVLGIP